MLWILNWKWILKRNRNARKTDRKMLNIVMWFWLSLGRKKLIVPGTFKPWNYKSSLLRKEFFRHSFRIYSIMSYVEFRKLINVKEISPLTAIMFKYESTIAQGVSGSGKFIVAPISFEVLPQLKTAPFNGPHFVQMRRRRKAALVSNGTVMVPSFLSLAFWGTKGRTYPRIDIRLRKKYWKTDVRGNGNAGDCWK